MAEFKPIFIDTIAREGGFRLHRVTGDRGGQTYAGIARNIHPDWPGWRLIDKQCFSDAMDLVPPFYLKHFWQPIHGDDIKEQAIAAAIYDFAVTSGVRTAVRAAQRVVDAFVDGVVGPETMAGLTLEDPEFFLPAYAVERIRHYAGIVDRDRSQAKFLLGWVNRALGMAA